MYVINIDYDIIEISATSHPRISEKSSQKIKNKLVYRLVKKKKNIFLSENRP